VLEKSFKSAKKLYEIIYDIRLSFFRQHPLKILSIPAQFRFSADTTGKKPQWGTLFSAAVTGYLQTAPKK